MSQIIEFIYLGAVNIPEDDAQIFKSTLESFRISLDDLDNSEDYEQDESKANEEQDTEMEQNLEIEQNLETEQNSEMEQDENFHERQFELIENDENAKKDDEPKPEVKIKLEPEWDESLIKEEPIKEEDLLVETSLPSVPTVIQQNQPVTVKRFRFQSQPTGIRIRTPASINEKARQPESTVRTVKLVPKLPDHFTVPHGPNGTNIQELSKRLSKAILIRRIRKSDGSIVSERSPIKIVQGRKTIGGLPLPVVQSKQSDQNQQTIFRCSHCTKAFTVNKRRNAHEKYCFKNPSRPPSQCPFCPMVLCNPAYIATHIRKVHGIDENGKSVKT